MGKKNFKSQISSTMTIWCYFILRYFRTETDEFNEEGSASATIVRWESLKAKEHLQKSEDV